MTRKGDRVSFQIGQIFLPDPHQVLASLTNDVEVEGTVVDFSDSGSTPQAFAVVRLRDEQTVVVPVDQLRVVTLCETEG